MMDCFTRWSPINSNASRVNVPTRLAQQRSGSFLMSLRDAFSHPTISFRQELEDLLPTGDRPAEWIDLQ